MNKDGVDITNVVVLIKGNRVVVTGTVPEASQIELATKAATKVAGDREVDAKLLGVAAAGR
jgi:osmotically-inducible protein OsmY